MNVLVVCHAGEGIGLGHLSRSLVVAKALRGQFDADVHLIVQGEPIARSDLEIFSHRFISPKIALGPIILDTVSEFRSWLVVLDIHPLLVPNDLSQVLEQIRRLGGRIIGIDGLLSFRNQLDLVFLPSLRRDDPLAQGAGTQVVYGLDCFLVPDWRRSSAWASGSQVLVLTGGSDEKGLGAEWPAMLDKELPSGAMPHWVRGPYAQPPQIPINSRLAWTLHHAPCGLRSQMNSANYAVTIFGVSFFELLKMGIPTVVFSPYGTKDYLDLQYIAKSEIALVATDEWDAVQLVKKLMLDDKLASELSKRAESSMVRAGGALFCELVARWR